MIFVVSLMLTVPAFSVTAMSEDEYDLMREQQARTARDQNTRKNACENHPNQTTFFDAYVWALMPDEMPRNFKTHGFGASQSMTTGLLGGFCQVRVETRIGDESLDNAYFMLGDEIKCGSWLMNDDLKYIRNRSEIQCIVGREHVGNFGDTVELR